MTVVLVVVASALAVVVLSEEVRRYQRIKRARLRLMELIDTYMKEPHV